jgi:hypothetical protein
MAIETGQVVEAMVPVDGTTGLSCAAPVPTATVLRCEVIAHRTTVAVPGSIAVRVHRQKGAPDRTMTIVPG